MGRHQLACLAKLILTVVANSAGAERLFSRMGNIHTKRRNRMHHDKVHDLATVAMDLAAQHRAASLTQKRAKRRFDIARPAPALRSASKPDNTHSDSLSDAPDDLTNSDPNADSPDEGDPMDEDEEEACDLRALAARFTKAVDDDVDEIESADEDEGLPEPTALIAQQCNPTAASSPSVLQQGTHNSTFRNV
jgi:hypothetical protein